MTKFELDCVQAICSSLVDLGYSAYRCNEDWFTIKLYYDDAARPYARVLVMAPHLCLYDYRHNQVFLTQLDEPTSIDKLLEAIEVQKRARRPAA